MIEPGPRLYPFECGTQSAIIPPSTARDAPHP